MSKDKCITSLIICYPQKEKEKNTFIYLWKRKCANRSNDISDNLNEVTVTKFMDILKVNPYYTFLKLLTVVSNLFKFYSALNSSFNLHQRTHNLSTASEVGAIWIKIN